MHRRPLPALAASVALVATPISAEDAPSLWDLITVEHDVDRDLVAFARQVTEGLTFQIA